MKKLYDVTITFDPSDYEGEVKTVGMQGEFLFYESGLTGHTDETGMIDCEKKYSSSQYQEHMDNIGGLYYQEMAYNEDTKCYEATMKLPTGVYPYTFVINPMLGEPKTDPKWSWSNVQVADGSLHNYDFKDAIISDPRNLPIAPTKTGVQKNSELYVGNPKDCPWIPIAEAEKKGRISYISYEDINHETQTMGVYLPAGYTRQKKYPVIYVTHGGGGNEADWFCQGGLGNIMDNLVAEGRTEAAVVVTMNNSVYKWDFEMISQNVLQCIRPYIETVYSVYTDPEHNAFCGLSMGSMTTLYVYYHHCRNFQYYGAFSGGIAAGEHFSLEDPHLKEVTLMIGCAEEDIAYNQRDIGIPPTIEQLKKAGIPFESYFVTGSHDWFCWPAMFTYFAENKLWKK